MTLHQEQPTAGKQPWSEAGIDLLKIGQRYVNGIIDPTHTQCKKKDCYFCYQMQPKVSKRAIVIKPILASETKYNNSYSAEEMSILFSNINEPYPLIMGLLPARSLSSLRTVKCVYAKKYGYKWNGERWINAS